MQDLSVNTSEGAGRVGFPCCYLVGALFSSMLRDLKVRVTLRAESYHYTWNSSGVSLHIIVLVGKSVCWRGTRSMFALGVCAGTAVHALNPEELPDVHKLL